MGKETAIPTRSELFAGRRSQREERIEGESGRAEDRDNQSK